jgi:hypothetical protein
VDAGKVVEHTFILDRLAGTYRDSGPATKLDKVLQHFSGGAVRVRPVEIKSASGIGVAGQADSFETAR